MSDQTITIDVSKALADIAQLKGGMVDVGAQAAKTGKQIENAFDSGFGQGVADAVQDLKREYKQLADSSNVLKSALRQATDPTAINLYVKSIAQLELGMKRLETAGKQAGVSLKELKGGANTGKEVFENFFGVFTKVALITAAISAVAKFATYAVNLSQQINSAKRSFEAFTGSASEAEKIVNNLIATGQKNFIPTDDILKAGKALLAFGENADNLPAVLERIANISAATGKDFNELTTIYGKARTAGVLYAEDINQLVDAGIPIIQEFAKQMGVSNDQVKKLASEGKISFSELELAMFNLTKEGAKFADQSQVNAQSIGGAWQRLVANVSPAISTIGDAFSSVVQSGLDKLNALVSFASELGTRLNKNYIKVTDEGSEKAAQDADRARFEKDIAEKEKLERQAAESRKGGKKRTAAEIEKIEREHQAAVLASMKDGVEKDIAAENFRYKALLKELRRFHLDTTQATEQHEKNLQEININAANRAYDLLQKSLEIRRQINEKDIELVESARKEKDAANGNRVDELTALRDLKNTEADIQQEAGEYLIYQLRQQGKSEAEIKEAQRQLDLENQKLRLENELNFQLAFLETIDSGNTAQLDQTLRTIDLIRAKINNVTAQEGGAPGVKKTILERLGLDRDSLKGLEQAKDQIIGALQDIAAAKVASAEQDLEIAQGRVDAAEDALQKEQDLQAQGFASNVSQKQKELDQAKQDEAKALAQKKAAQKQQLALDSALQLSGLITTSVNILKGWSTIPFVGQVLGIAAIASMFAAFAVTRSRAAQAINKFKHGGQGRVSGDSIIVGASHDDGGVGIEAEGGEFFGTDGKRFGIVNKQMTSKHFDLLAAVNKNDHKGMIAAVSRITMNKEAVSNSIGEGRGSVAVIGGGNKETNKILTDWRSEQRSSKTTTVEGGYVVERQGNHTRRIAIK